MFLFFYHSSELQHFPLIIYDQGSPEAAGLFPRFLHFLLTGWGFHVRALHRTVCLGGQADGVFNLDKGWVDGAGHWQASPEAQFTRTNHGYMVLKIQKDGGWHFPI